MSALAAADPETTRDAVTGLPGRDAARSHLTRWLAEGGQIHAMLVGLRRLDAVNLAYGAAAGDAALAEVSARLKQFAARELTGAWMVARIGGGQFLLLSGQPCSRETWQLEASRLMDSLARPIASRAATLRLSPCCALIRGLAEEGPDSILDRLGETLARVTRHAGRRYLWADGEVTRVGRSMAQLEADLLRALDGNEIELLYQPQFACADDRLVGAEALARWNHPTLGRISAGALFSVAERADHVAQLSRHIARVAMAGAKVWPMDLRLSLNVTPNDLASASFAKEFVELADELQFPLWRLTMEVTEQVLLSDVKQAAQVLDVVVARGARIALDDFGAGFCNFRYLKLLPLHTLKLDRSMVDGIATNPRDLAVLRAIIAMARGLDMKVIAEGIENEAQRVLVAAEGCSAYQGFLRAKPMAAEVFLDFARGG